MVMECIMYTTYLFLTPCPYRSPNLTYTSDLVSHMWIGYIDELSLNFKYRNVCNYNNSWSAVVAYLEMDNIHEISKEYNPNYLRGLCNSMSQQNFSSFDDAKDFVENFNKFYNFL